MENNPYKTPTASDPASAQSLPMNQSSDIPKIFGIIHIVYAVIGGGMGLIGVISALFLQKTGVFSGIEKLQGEGGSMEGISSYMDELSRWSLIDGVVKIILAIILLFAGIMLLKRKIIGAKLSKLWAILRILSVVPMSYFSTVATMKMQEGLFQGGSAAAATANVTSLTLLGAIVGNIFVIIYPIVTLVFMLKFFLKDSLH